MSKKEKGMILMAYLVMSKLRLVLEVKISGILINKWMKKIFLDNLMNFLEEDLAVLEEVQDNQKAKMSS
jgi:hypothetical protein